MNNRTSLAGLTPVNIDMNYTNDTSLSSIDNLTQAHNKYEEIHNKCQEVVVQTAIKLGEIYIKAKAELGTSDKEASNEIVGQHFGKSETTIRNYIKIYNNKDKFETAVANDLSVRKMLEIINGKTDKPKVKKEPVAIKGAAKKDDYIDRLEQENQTLMDENKKLKATLKSLIPDTVHTKMLKDLL